jgi:hypothetical protein
VEFETKLLPFTVSVKVAAPVLAEAGESEVIAGTGSFVAKVAAVDVPPPGAGFTTVTLPVPAVAMSAAVIVAVTWVPPT